MDAPSTVTEAIALLRAEGYLDDIDLVGGALECARTETSQPWAGAQIDHTFRFEGDSDPADESIVLGLRFPGTDVKGVLVSAYGPAAEPEVAEFFASLRQR